MTRKAKAQWQGDLKTGKGNLSTDSGVLARAAYSYPSRFENDKGTNPKELLAAAPSIRDGASASRYPLRAR